MFVPPSPKLQNQPVTVPVELSVNWIVRGALPVVGVALKLAVGPPELTVMVVDCEDDCVPFEMVRVTVKVPALLKVWLGFRSELFPPSPKFHDQELMVPVD